MVVPLNINLLKCVMFGGDGASTMVSSHSEIATKLKNKINPPLLSCHCVSHWTNPAVVNASKVLDCTIISSEVDILLNVVVYFIRQVNVKMHLQPCKNNYLMLEKWYNGIIIYDGSVRWQVVTTLRDSLEPVSHSFVMWKTKNPLSNKINFCQIKITQIYLYFVCFCWYLKILFMYYQMFCERLFRS